MGYPTAIEWTDATWNPVGGCSIHSPGCNPCYAMKLAASARLNKHPLYAGTTDIMKGKAVWNGKLTKLPDDHQAWTWPLRWRGATNPAHPPKLGPGKPSLIFVADMSDLFIKGRPREHIDRVVAAIIYSRHIGQMLTKRPDEMADYFAELQASGRWLEFLHPLFGKPNFDPACATFANSVLPKLWLGCSVERQKEANERLGFMSFVASIGFTTFVSYEPALGPVDWAGWEFLDQIIAGGTSGTDADPSHPDWFRTARDWCAANGIAFFFKQWGEWAPPPKDAGESYEASRARGARDMAVLKPDLCIMELVGKNRAGRLLDGVEHNGFPEVH